MQCYLVDDTNPPHIIMQNAKEDDMGDNVCKVYGSGRISRRCALGLAFGVAWGASGGTRLAIAQPRPELGSCPINIGQHNMMVLGVRSVFLSHLPMFVGVCPDRAHFETEHRFQLILEAGFEEPRTKRDITELYKQDRLQHSDTRMYSLSPGETFALAEIFLPPTFGAPRRSFQAQLFRGHLERPPTEVILPDVTVQIKRVVHAHEFLPEDERPENLEYILFGAPDELFLAHRIVVPGDFDQLLPVRIPDQQFSPADLSQVLRVVVSGRPNVSSARLQGGQNSVAQLLRTDAQARSITLQPLREVYFEESELAIPPSFDDTQEERDAGFGH
jgi:hypothetical protein